MEIFLVGGLIVLGIGLAFGRKAAGATILIPFAVILLFILAVIYVSVVQ